MKRVVLAVAGSLLAFAAFAQSSVGHITGDAKKGDVVAIYSPDVGVKRETTMEEDGRYMFRRLPLGSYEVTVKHPDGTEEQTKFVTLRVGQTAKVQ